MNMCLYMHVSYCQFGFKSEDPCNVGMCLISTLSFNAILGILLMLSSKRKLNWENHVTLRIMFLDDIFIDWVLLCLIALM